MNFVFAGLQPDLQCDWVSGQHADRVIKIQVACDKFSAVWSQPDWGKQHGDMWMMFWFPALFCLGFICLKCKQVTPAWTFCPSDQRGEELPTLLHFAAKYGLKKLTAVLQECPGALQAYSVMNKHGDYPNKLAEKSGFSDLRQLMDKFVVSQVKNTLFPSVYRKRRRASHCSVCTSQDTAAMTKPKVEAEEPISMDEQADVYEMMSGASQDVAIISEDIYESMFAIDPECVEDLCKRI